LGKLPLNTKKYNSSIILSNGSNFYDDTEYDFSIVEYLTEGDHLHAIEPITHIVCEAGMVSMTNSDHIAGQFRCGDETLIWDHFICDGEYDCFDKSDENNCKHLCSSSGVDHPVDCYESCTSENCQCGPLLHQCENNGCLPSRVILSDVSCTSTSTSSSATESVFMCNDGTAIPVYYEGDLMADCLMAEDENTLKNAKANYLKDKIKSSDCNSQGKLSCLDLANVCYDFHEICLYDRDQMEHLKPCRHGTHLYGCERTQCHGMSKKDIMFKTSSLNYV